MDSSRLLRTSAITLSLVGLLMAGCTEGGTTPAASAPAPASAASTEQLKEYYGQRPVWRACGTSGF